MFINHFNICSKECSTSLKLGNNATMHIIDISLPNPSHTNFGEEFIQAVNRGFKIVRFPNGQLVRTHFPPKIGILPYAPTMEKDC